MICWRGSRTSSGPDGMTAAAMQTEIQQQLPAILSWPAVMGGVSQWPIPIIATWQGEAAIATPATGGARSTDSAIIIRRSLRMLMTGPPSLAEAGRSGKPNVPE